MTGTGQDLRPAATGEMLVTDLLAGAGTLAERLGEALRGGQWLDAYLLAAGLSQLAEDRLHADPFMLNRAASYLRGRPAGAARLAGSAAGAAGAVVRAGRTMTGARLRRARNALTTLTGQLAGQVLVPGTMPDPEPLLAAVTPALPGLAGDVLRLPACFHSFDQHPDDIRWLADAFRDRYPRRQVPLCVLGVRTSGSYLAPLHAAALRATGSTEVTVLTYRPGRPFQRWERTALRSVARAGGMVLICDDPPGSGTSLATAARAATAAGFADQAVVFLLSLFGTAADLPGPLSGWPAVVQPWGEWSIHRRLGQDRIQQALAALADPDTGVGEVRPLAGPASAARAAAGRGHVRARYEVTFTDRRTGEESARQILAEGAGLGYLGRQGLAVAGALPGRVPHVYGFRDGLLLRDWLPAGAAADPGLAGTIARYVADRRRALPAPSATVDRLGGRDPVWEVAARLLSGQFGPLAVPARPLLLDPLVRRLLRHEDPMVVDGKTGHGHWLPDPAAGGALRKVDFYQRAFGHLDLACYDPVFDLAGAAADPPGPDFERQLRDAYAGATGEPVDPERWLLYRLAQLWRLGCAGDLEPGQVRRRSAAAIHGYLAGWYLSGLPAATGPLCAIDLDGVLECDRLGYPVTSPTGMLALRALIAHGYRPVLATGRSAADVRDRCEAFGLPGGVAEYGAALLVQGSETDLRPPAAAELLGRIRAGLSGRGGVEIDPGYAYVVRARSGHGPVPDRLLAGVPALADPAVRVVHGEGQTDIMVAGVDKGTGLAMLAARLAAPGYALAVGDSPPDLPMFALATLARATGNARLPASATVRRTRGAYQAGLVDACTALLGHRPGGCPACRPPEPADRTRALLAMLDLRANGLATIPVGTAALGALLRRRTQW